MKKLLIVLGTIFLIVIVLIGAVVGFLVIKGPVLDKESKAYANTSLSAVFSTWDEQAFLNRASPEFMRAMTKGDLDKYFLGLAHKLGRMHSCEGCVGESDVNISTGVISAQYAAKTVFDGGPATIALSLIKHGGKWEICGFNVSSPALVAQ